MTTPELIRAVPERHQCRHGIPLTSVCRECAKTPEMPRDWLPSDELDGIAIGTAEEERQRAKNWMDDAARHARDADFWRDRAKAAETKLATGMSAGTWGKVELKGIKRKELLGFIDEVVRYRHTFCRVQIPLAGGGEGWAGEKLVSADMIYGQDSMSEADVRAFYAPTIFVEQPGESTGGEMDPPRDGELPPEPSESTHGVQVKE